MGSRRWRLVWVSGIDSTVTVGWWQCRLVQRCWWRFVWVSGTDSTVTVGWWQCRLVQRCWWKLVWVSGTDSTVTVGWWDCRLVQRCWWSLVCSDLLTAWRYSHQYLPSQFQLYSQVMYLLPFGFATNNSYTFQISPKPTNNSMLTP
jgi:hypothetical protein